MFNPFLRSRLFDAAGEGDGGGGNPPPVDDPPAGDPPDGGDPKPEPLTLDAILTGLSGKLPDLIKQTVTPEITKQLNGLDAKVDKRLKALEKTVVSPKPPEGAPKNENPFWEDEKTQLTERLHTLETQNADRERQAQERELDAEVKTALADLPWQAGKDGAPSPGRDIAFDYYKSKAKRTDSGELVIQDVSLNKFVRQHAAMYFKSYFTPRELGGSGASASNNTKRGFDLDNIKPGMTAEEDAAAKAAVVAALNNLKQYR